MIGLEEYYSEAGPDYAAWSPSFNMHFGYYRWGMNPMHREAMLERMNLEVLDRLQVNPAEPVQLLDMGCGLAATMRTLAARLPLAELTGVTLVPWQVATAIELNRDCAGCNRIHLALGDYERTALPSASFDGVYALESSCHAHRVDKAFLLSEAFRLLKPGGRLVIADGFLASGHRLNLLQRTIYRKLCECWVIETLAELQAFTQKMKAVGFRNVKVEPCQLQVSPSVFHIPWVTAKFLMTDVVFGSRKMTRARWNNVLAPILLPLVGYPVGPMKYCMVSAVK